MTFAHPWLLLLLLLLPLLAWLKGRRGQQAAFLYSSVQLVKGIVGITRSSAGFILPKLRWLALILFLVALARPQQGEGEARIKASGIDIVVALDLSGSMASEDFEMFGRPANRLQIAKDVRGRSLPRCAHWVAEEEPEALLAELLTFFGEEHSS